MFSNPAINVYTHYLLRLVAFYEGLGFRETFRTPKDGAPVHVEVVLDGFTIGIASVDAAIADHGLAPRLDGRPAGRWRLCSGPMTPTATMRGSSRPVRRH